MNKLFVRIGIFVAIVSLSACTGGDSSPGYEYMPNMYRSPGIETYGEHNIEGYNGMPVEGTIARGKLSTFNYDESIKGYRLAGGYKLDSGAVLINYLGDTIEKDGTKIDIKNGENPIILKSDTFIIGTATYPDSIYQKNITNGRIVSMPFIKDSIILAQGQELFEMMCSHCHGNNGDGKGSIKHDVYSAVPSFSEDIQPRRSGTTMSELKEGHIFHTITYGLNAMGPHASQITEEERWKIVYYIQEKLQNN